MASRWTRLNRNRGAATGPRQPDATSEALARSSDAEQSRGCPDLLGASGGWARIPEACSACPHGIERCPARVLFRRSGAAGDLVAVPAQPASRLRPSILASFMISRSPARQVTVSRTAVSNQRPSTRVSVSS